MTIPVLPDYTAPYKPVPQVTPLTYRDNDTLLKKIDWLKKYINRTLVPFVNENFKELGDDFETQVNILIAAVNAAIESVINSGVIVQDPVVAGIIGDEDSQTRAALDARYGLKTAVDALETLVNTGRLSQTELDEAYAAKAAFDTLSEIIDTGRLSQPSLDARYGLKSDVDALEETVTENERKQAKYPVYNANPNSLRKSNIALATAMRGGGPMRILTVGDSTTQGAETVAQSYPTYLIDVLKRRGIKAGLGIIAPATNIPDYHWGVTGGWTISQVLGPAGGTFRSAAGNANSLYIAPNEVYTSFKVHFVRGTGGKCVVDRQGVNLAPQIDSTVGTPNTYGYTEFVQAGDGVGPDDVYGIHGPTGGPINILGLEMENSAEPKEVAVTNFGQSGVTTQDWVNDQLSLNFINYLAPHLTIVMLGINDSISNVNVNDYKNRMANIITTAQAFGDVIVIGFPKSNPTFAVGGSAVGPFQEQYEDAMLDYCKTNEIPYLDFNGRAGDYSDYITNDWYRDEVHQSNEANMSIALALADLIV